MLFIYIIFNHNLIYLQIYLYFYIYSVLFLFILYIIIIIVIIIIINHLSIFPLSTIFFLSFFIIPYPIPMIMIIQKISIIKHTISISIHLSLSTFLSFMPMTHIPVPIQKKHTPKPLRLPILPTPFILT